MLGSHEVYCGPVRLRRRGGCTTDQLLPVGHLFLRYTGTQLLQYQWVTIQVRVYSYYQWVTFFFAIQVHSYYQWVTIQVYSYYQWVTLQLCSYYQWVTLQKT